MGDLFQMLDVDEGGTLTQAEQLDSYDFRNKKYSCYLPILIL